jgi:hypothetical protein
LQWLRGFTAKVWQAPLLSVFGAAIRRCAVVYPAPNWDVYFYGGFYGGVEKAFKETFANDTIGYGVPLLNNTGCDIENTSTSLCQGVNETVWQLTGGFWDRLYKGKAGTLSWGLQYSHTQRQLFEGIGGSPTTDDQMVFASFRYYPFQ